MQSPMLSHMQPKIKLNRRGLTELVLACAFIALLTYAAWSWHVNGGYVAAMDMESIAQHSTLLPQMLNHPAIILSTVVAEFILLLALTLAIVPPAWWLRADHILGSEPGEPTTPLRWLGKKIHSGQTEAQPEEGQMMTNAAGEPIYYEQVGMPGTVANPFNLPPGQAPVPGQVPQAGPYVMGQPVPGQMQPGQPIPGQPIPGQMQPGKPQPGQPVPGQLQPGQPGQPVPGQMPPGQPVPGQPVPGQVQPIPGQPATVEEVKPGQQPGAQPPAAPVAPLSDVLNFEETVEDDPLADLANIKDILNSAFDEDLGIDPDREALGRTLEEIDLQTIRTSARQILATFTQ